MRRRAGREAARGRENRSGIPLSRSVWKSFMNVWICIRNPDLTLSWFPTIMLRTPILPEDFEHFADRPEVYLCNGRRSFFPWKRRCSGIDRMSAGKPRPRVTLQKCDPYLNVDPGTMSPYQHGEVFVTDDGAETDLDLGHYERFTSAQLTRDHNWTTGRIYESISPKNAAAIISARLFKSFRTSPMKSNRPSEGRRLSGRGAGRNRWNGGRHRVASVP